MSAPAQPAAAEDGDAEYRRYVQERAAGKQPESATAIRQPAATGEMPAKAKRRSGSEKRRRATGPVLVRLLPEERAAVEEKAATAGLSLAAFGRACMLGDAGPRAKKRPPVDRELLARTNGELNRVGNNLNQIARALNRGRDDELDPYGLRAAGRELLATLTDIRRALGYDRQS